MEGLSLDLNKEEKMKITGTMVVILPLAILWAIMGVVCLFWDLPAGEMHFGGFLFHIAFYAGTVFGAFGLFSWLVENANTIADWWNERQTEREY